MALYYVFVRIYTKVNMSFTHVLYEEFLSMGWPCDMHLSTNEISGVD